VEIGKNILNHKGGGKMATLKEEASSYEKKQTKNIAELDSIPIDLELENREGKDNEGKPFKYKVAVLNGEDYRVPWTVLSDLKAILKVRPDLKNIKVNKDGHGLATKYTVVAL
tara:strand:- start:320 stop:658 length:339 start_codon:yes stop_codon:yes gene_type:complete